MMKGLLLAIAALAAFLAPVQAAAQEIAIPKPQVVLIEMDPWLMVIGSDSPSFAMYDNGQVIYRVEGGYRTTELSADRQAKFVAAMEFGDAKKDYEVSERTDQPTNILIFSERSRTQTISVYGDLQRSDARSGVPPAIIAAYDLMHGFDDPAATEWLPEKVEIMIWPYEYAPESSIHWPSNFPGIDDPDTVRRGDSYSIFLPSAKFGELQAFANTRKPKGAIVIEGKKWALSWRFPFPGIRFGNSGQDEGLSP